MMNTGGFRNGKRMEPRLWKQKKFDEFINVRFRQYVPVILYINIEGLCANKICVISQMATRRKALVIILRETHCTNANQLSITPFAPAGCVSSRKHGVAIFFQRNLAGSLWISPQKDQQLNS